MHAILAARSDFSVGESILTTDRLVKIAKEAGETVVALTDTMSVTGMIDFSNNAKKAGLKPIIGVRLRLSDNPTWRPGEGEKKRHMPPDYFVTLYALTEAGIKAIYRLLTLANSEDRFYYTAKLGFEDLQKELWAQNDDLALMLGETNGLIAHPKVRDLIADFTRAGRTRIFAPLVPVNTPYFDRVTLLSIELAADGLAEPLVVRPALYDAGNADCQEIMAAIVENQRISDPWFKSAHNRDFHPLRLTDLMEEVKAAIPRLERRGAKNAPAFMFRRGLVNTRTLVDLVSFQWSKSPVSLPQMAPDEFAAVVAEVKKGWAQRFAQPTFGHQPSLQQLRDEYQPRLAYELEVLKKLNFSGYFLLVQDVVNFAKSNGILVGPGRGSVGGSLVAYLMGITDCDPIRFGLLFERFINPDRIDLPDADLDFMSERRHEIVEYLVGKYGEKRVAGVSNFGTLAAASAIRDVGRVTGIPERDYSVSKFVPKLHGANVPLPDCRAAVAEIDVFAKTYAPFWTIMERLEGTIRNFSQHAAGIVVGGVDLVDRGVVEKRKDSAVVCWDKTMVEEQGLVKMDILGLTTLDLIALTLSYIRERHGKRVNLLRIPLDDPKVLENFAKAMTTGIFQFESGGMRRLLKELGADGTITFDDITAATALYRPGPMESGMMDSYYLRKQGNEAVDYDHALMEPILSPTFGVIVYQEQVMQISRAIAGYSAAAADKLRKIMGKKLPEEMKKERSKFVEGCVATIGCKEEWAGALFDKIEGFAGYGFNKSHSVEYTLISYQSMWLKTYYPVEFFAASLTLMDQDKLPAILRDAKGLGIEIAPPDINLSTDRFEIVTDKKLTMPFQRIKGISSNTTVAILAARQAGEFKSKNDFIARVERRRCNVKHQDSLDKVGAFARIEPGTPSATDPVRVRDQIELLPGLIASHVPIDREMHTDKATKNAIAELVDEYIAAHGPGSAEPDGMPVKSTFGRNAKIMLISDAPNNEEDAGGLMGFSLSQNAVIDAMLTVGLARHDVYWTALLKRPKRGKTNQPAEIALYAPYLLREIEILRPTVIVLLGSTTVRYFFPDFKGKASESAGKVVYSKERDANFVIGFSPGEIYHDATKQQNMNDVFGAVSELL